MSERIESYVEFGNKDTAIVLNRKALNYGQLVVRASVNGHKGLFLIDTGATMSLINEKFAIENGIKINEAEEDSYGAERQGGFIGIKKSKCKTAVVDLKFANKTVVHDLLVFIMKDYEEMLGKGVRVDGIIGIDVLHHARLSINLTYDVLMQIPNMEDGDKLQVGFLDGDSVEETFGCEMDVNYIDEEEEK